MNALWRLQSVFREVFGDPALRITEETSVSNFSEWDSVATVQIVLATEAEFGVRFATDDVAGIRSVADILKLVENHADVR